MREGINLRAPGTNGSPWFKPTSKNCFNTRAVEEHSGMSELRRECRSRVPITLSTPSADRETACDEGLLPFCSVRHMIMTSTPLGAGLIASQSDRYRFKCSINNRASLIAGYSSRLGDVRGHCSQLQDRLMASGIVTFECTPTLDRAPKWELSLWRWTNSPGRGLDHRHKTVTPGEDACCPAIIPGSRRAALSNGVIVRRITTDP